MNLRVLCGEKKRLTAKNNKELSKRAQEIEFVMLTAEKEKDNVTNN